MINDKISEIILCSGIKMDKNYENVLSYSDEDMVALCRNKSIYDGTNYAIVNDTTIRVACKYEDAIYANYIAYINPRYGNKWFFGWVTSVKLLNPNTTEITYQKDVFSTWYERFNVGQAFIEREHTSDDTVGKNTVPENLEYGEYVVDEILRPNINDDIESYYIMATTIYPHINSSSGTDKIDGSNTGGGLYNNIMSGLTYFAFLNTTNGVAYLKRVIQAYANSGLSDAIKFIFMAPKWAFSITLVEPSTNPVWGTVDESTSARVRSLTYNNNPLISKPTTLDTYTPVNKKLLQFPYSYFILSNGNGGNAIYKYEYFNNPSPNQNYIEFMLSSAITPSMSVLARPLFYKYKGASGYNDNENLIGAKFPIAGWESDTYTNWLTQNALNHKIAIISGSVSAGIGVAELAGGDVAGANMLGSGLGSIFNVMREVKQAKEFMTPQAEGNLNCGDINFSLNLSHFIGYKMSIKKEWAERLDKYFSRFGYQTNLVKTPNLNSRTKFNFIKVGGMDELISGNIPATDLEEINGIFRKGVTIFHDYDAIGNYTISNPIRS